MTFEYSIQSIFLPSTHGKYENMPIFSKLFDVKTVPIRAKRSNDYCPVLKEKLNDYSNIGINLNNTVSKFAGGRWTHEQYTGEVGDIADLKKRIRILEDANNLSQLKIDVLLDLLTENLSELNNKKSKMYN